MIKKFAVFLLFAICFLLFAIPVTAKDFSSFYKTTYEFNEDGTAVVTQEISLVNQSDNLYVSEYTLSLLGEEISKVEAYDRIGPLTLNVDKKDKTVLVTMKFNEKIVGKEKVLSFILKYHASGSAEKVGNLWQISLPQLVNTKEIDEYQLFLKVPTSFGKIAFVNPLPKSQKSDEEFYLLSFDKNDLSNHGVSLTLGLYQIFNFDLNFDLKNETETKRKEKIALPPDTNYQSVYYQSLTPKPLNVTVDDDGNWLAEYELLPSQTLTIEAKGQAKVFSQAQNIFPQIKLETTEYLAATKYWPVNDQKISDLARELKTPENIYNFVVKTLKYDYQSINEKPVRKGAKAALNDPTHCLCSEFTDLFVSLCRAAGIPSRELEGYAYTDNPKLSEELRLQDILHSWPEYYDKEKNIWIMVDPTWGNTTNGLDYFNKFDMNHFVFVIHGKSDDFPFPAGSYKEGQNLAKQILINYNPEEIVLKEKFFSLQNLLPKTVLTLKKSKVVVTFKNEEGKAFYDVSFSLNSAGDKILAEKKIAVLPPFSSFGSEFEVRPKELGKDYFLPLTFKIGNEEIITRLAIKSSGFMIALVTGSFLAIILIKVLFSLRKNKKTGKNAKMDIDS